MYSRQEAAQLTKEFWTSFGNYMSPIPSAEGDKINWLNYRTGLPEVSIKAAVLPGVAYAGLELTHADEVRRKMFFNHLISMKHILLQESGTTWNWQEEFTDQFAKSKSIIFQRLQGVNVYSKADWPQIITFLKSRLIALDRFWSSVKYSLPEL